MAHTTVLDLRVAADLTQDQLAEKAGVSRFTIQEAEAGRPPRRPLTQERIARALGVPRDDLFPERTVAV